jgi:hypothetical protein
MKYTVKVGNKYFKLYRSHGTCTGAIVEEYRLSKKPSHTYFDITLAEKHLELAKEKFGDIYKCEVVEVF